MNNLKITLISLIILVVIVVFVVQVLPQDEPEELELYDNAHQCANDICSDYLEYEYDENTNLCTCSNRLFIAGARTYNHKVSHSEYID